MMEIPAGKYCDEPFKKGMVCAFFLDACLFPDDRAEEPVVVRQSIEDGTETAYERCPSCLSAYPHGAVVELKKKESEKTGNDPKEKDGKDVTMDIHGRERGTPSAYDDADWF